MRTLAIIGALSAPLMAQQEDPCGPRMPARLETNRTTENGRTTTVSTGDRNDGRSMTTTYSAPEAGTIGSFQVDGEVTWVNNGNRSRDYSFRQIIALGPGVVPMIPEGFDYVCYEPSKDRLVVLHTRTVLPGEVITDQIYFELTTRQAGQIADLNGDGWVDELDLAELIGGINGQDGRYDLNGDGLVDVADLEILRSMLSESWGDSRDQATADPVTPDPIEDGMWSSSDSFIELEFLELPNDDVREGHHVVPLTDWQLT